MLFLNFDWEMMTYWAIVGLSHALAYHNEAQARTLSASQLETRLVEAQLQSLQRQLQTARQGSERLVRLPLLGHRFPPEVISHAIWLYFRFPLSLRMVEKMLPRQLHF